MNSLDFQKYMILEQDEASLKERFEKFDKIAEYNQIKGIHAMQKNKVSAECFQSHQDMDMMILDEILWKKCMQILSGYGSLHWYARRSPAELMHWQLPYLEIFVREMNFLHLQESHTIP